MMDYGDKQASLAGDDNVYPGSLYPGEEGRCWEACRQGAIGEFDTFSAIAASVPFILRSHTCQKARWRRKWRSLCMVACSLEGSC